MKRILPSLMLLALLLALVAACLPSCGDKDVIVLNVYNWGEYIADGSDGYLDVISEFEKETGIKVNYTTYETNEELYSILKAKNSNYDVIITSEYMVEKLINEGFNVTINQKSNILKGSKPSYHVDKSRP